VVWDGGDPWRVRLQVQSQPAEQQWQLSGELFREGQVRSLDEPVLLLARGLVLFPECLARLDAAEHFSWIAALRKQPVIEIPHRDRQAFRHSLWTAANVPPIELPEELQLEQVQGVPQGKLSIHAPDRAGSPSELRAEVRFVYGEHAVPLADRRAALLDADQGRAILRDSVAERALLAQLADLGMYPPPRYLPGQADVHFPLCSLAQVVEQLTAQGWLVESEGRLIRRAGAIHLSVSTSVDWFELGGGVDFDGVEVPLPRLLAALRSKHKYVRLDDGTHGLLPDEWLQQFSGLIDLSDADADVLRFSPSQALLLDSLLAAQEDVQVDDPFDQLRQRLRTFEGVEPGSEPRGFRGELRNYQKDGLGWLHFLREFRFGGCLADDMGLGKTVQVLALLQSRRTRRLKQGQQRRPSLVVVPKSLVFNWIDEATRFAPRLRVLDYTGLGRHALLQQLDQCDLLVTTYGTLRRDVLPLKEIRFDYVILDESQAIKNANSQAAKACRLLQADHRLAMTGTPVENNLGELWSLFEFLNPGILGRSRAFHDFVKQGQESGESARLLSRALRPFLLRRTKEQVLSELPDKTEQTLHCEMAPKQRKLYEELREYYRRSLAQRVEQVGIEQAKIHVLEALLRLRQAACHPGLLDATRIGESSAKLDLLLAQIREIVAEGHKALVFSQFTSLLAIVRTHLDKLDITYEYLDGRTRDRKERVQRFQEDAGCPLFLISLKAGGHGLNLTAADYVFILDPWWNPAVESQAIDRAHRLGQTRNVFAYRLICRDTVEDKIVELQRSKRELADAIISADNSLIRQLSVEDLQLLLS
jgi:superfamily II DNA or RNA helicase